jgi:type IV secretory pathway protease TraF
VGALSGDEVELAHEGLRINGRLLPKTAPLSLDARGQPMLRTKPASLTIHPGEILVFAAKKVSI